MKDGAVLFLGAVLLVALAVWGVWWGTPPMEVCYSDSGHREAVCYPAGREPTIEP